MAAAMDKDMDVWKQVFQELIQEVKPWHKWTLTLDKELVPNDLKPGWLQYQQRTFARFRCSSCARSWASANILVLFHMHWCRKQCRGQVKMRVFAQRCNKCRQPPFEVPEFMKDNITRLLNNLVFKILKKCYREGLELEEIPAIRDICLEGPHDSHNCEACLQGLCAQSGSGLPSKAPTSPLSPTLPKPQEEEPRVTGTCTNLPCSPPNKVDKARAPTVKPKAHYPTKADPHVTPQYHTSKPISPPTLTTHQPPPNSSCAHTPYPAPISSRTPYPSPVSSRTSLLATQIPSPTKNSTEVRVASSGTRLKKGGMSPSSSSSSSSYAVPTAWRAPAHSVYQVERSADTYQGSERRSSTHQRCVPQNPHCGCCGLMLLLVAIAVVWLVVKYS